MLLSVIQRLQRISSKWGNRFRLAWYGALYGDKLTLNNTWLGDDFDFDIKESGYKIHFGNNIVFRKHSIISIRQGSNLRIGNNAFFNNYIAINCRGNITIGDHCLFGENVKLYDHNHRFSNMPQYIGLQGFTIGTITIGNNCWIGSNVVILKNVTIGDNVVIGANCVIQKDIPSNTIVRMGDALVMEPLRHKTPVQP